MLKVSKARPPPPAVTLLAEPQAGFSRGWALASLSLLDSAVLLPSLLPCDIHQRLASCRPEWPLPPPTSPPSITAARGTSAQLQPSVPAPLLGLGFLAASLLNPSSGDRQQLGRGRSGGQVRGGAPRRPSIPAIGRRPLLLTEPFSRLPIERGLGAHFHSS